jgi:hypothetical protein
MLTPLHSLNSFSPDYHTKVKKAEDFAHGVEGLAWNGLYQMGLAIAGLTMIPVENQITPKPYWYRNKPCWVSRGEMPEWGPCWIAEVDAFEPKKEKP